MKCRTRVIVGSDERTGDETVLLRVKVLTPDDEKNGKSGYQVSISNLDYRSRLLVKPDRIHVTEATQSGLKNYVGFDRSLDSTWSFRYGVVVDEDERGWLIQGSLWTLGAVVFDSEKILDQILEVSLENKN